MPRIRIEVDGDQKAARALRALGKDIGEVTLARIEEALQKVVRRMKRYPPPRPGQRYKRTGRLGASWDVSAAPQGFVISNNARAHGRAYARYVVGDARGQKQAWMHKDRWPVFREVVLKYLGDLPKKILSTLRVSGRRVG